MDRRASILRFGSDGWHARLDGDFSEENVVRLADALGVAWAGVGAVGATVYVGYDTREGADELAHQVAGVLASCGLAVRVSDRACPTPAIAWACARDRSAIGAVVLTASERSCEYGGFLVRASDGGPAPREFLDQVEQLVGAMPPSARGAFEVVDVMGPYLANLRGLVDGDAIASAGLKVLVDPMYGAGVGCLGGVLESLGCMATEIHDEKLADFGGIHPEPADPWADACERAVRAGGYDAGLLLDGDADRAAIVDEQGRILSPHLVTPLVLGHLVEDRGMTGRVVTTLTCSAYLLRQAERLGLELVTVPVGFSGVHREILEGDVLLGAEEYGGVAVPAHLHERDGLLVALLLVEMIAQRGQGVSQLAAGLEASVGRMRYARRDVRLDSASTQALRNVLPGLNPPEMAGRAPVEVSHADGLRLTFADDSWVLVRPSRTDPVVRVYSEAPTEGERDELLDASCELVRAGL